MLNLLHNNDKMMVFFHKPKKNESIPKSKWSLVVLLKPILPCSWWKLIGSGFCVWQTGIFWRKNSLLGNIWPIVELTWEFVAVWFLFLCYFHSSRTPTVLPKSMDISLENIAPERKAFDTKSPSPNGSGTVPIRCVLVYSYHISLQQQLYFIYKQKDSFVNIKNMEK